MLSILKRKENHREMRSIRKESFNTFTKKKSKSYRTLGTTSIKMSNPFTLSLSAYLTTHPHLAGLIVSAIPIHRPSPSHPSRALVVQRAATDGFPLKWETPGGGVDPTDTTILDALRRELHEETGLTATNVALIDDTVEFTGKRADGSPGVWRKITFAVQVGDGNNMNASPGDRTGDGGMSPVVIMNPAEHVDYIWAKEDEVVEGRCEGRVLDFAYPESKGLILRAFAAWGAGGEDFSSSK